MVYKIDFTGKFRARHHDPIYGMDPSVQRLMQEHIQESRAKQLRARIDEAGVC